jgi:HD-GYP domain-containing protein (c-di-GMP phosphodiesterase class II)
MRLCATGEVEEGMVLGKSIYQVNGRLLLGAGYRIDGEMKAKLIEKGYTHIYIFEEGTEDIIPEDVISEELRQQAQSRLADKLDEIHRLAEFKEMTYTRAMDLLENGYLQKVNITYEMRGIVKDILNEIYSTGARFQSTILYKAKDTFFLDHSINTTVVSTLIGIRFRFSRPELVSLALGAYLHDIGKVIIDQLENDPSKTGRSLYREHPTFGYLLLRNSPDVSPMEIQVVNQHHEYQDGSGFPIGLVGENLPPVRGVYRKKGSIFRLAEICCVASEYDNLVMNPLGDSRRTPEEALKKIILDAGKIYNKSIVTALHDIIPIFPVGSTIQIEDIIDPALAGCFGVVAKINPEKFARPVIIITMNKFRKKIKPIMIDTSKLHNIKLKLIL